MGLFEDRTDDAIKAAIAAVRKGTANSTQEDLATRASRQMGTRGSEARAAFDRK